MILPLKFFYTSSYSSATYVWNQSYESFSPAHVSSASERIIKKVVGLVTAMGVLDYWG